MGDDWVVASETCALDLIGARVGSGRAPGEVLWLDETGISQCTGASRGAPRGLHLRARLLLPDPTRGSAAADPMRAASAWASGSRRSPAVADLVMPIPDSGTPAAIGFAKASGIPYDEGLIKNRYVGRTFIQPDQELRRQGIRLKFNPLDDIAGQHVVIVDDSIVRADTMQQLVAMLVTPVPAEVHVRISSPPVVSPCFYGIDMADEDELAAAHRSVEEMRMHVGATSLHYLSLEGMQWASRMPEGTVCRTCFTREYPTSVPVGASAKMRFETASV